jgi:hypothetical protein
VLESQLEGLALVRHHLVNDLVDRGRQLGEQLACRCLVGIHSGSLRLDSMEA